MVLYFKILESHARYADTDSFYKYRLLRMLACYIVYSFIFYGNILIDVIKKKKLKNVRLRCMLEILQERLPLIEISEITAIKEKR